MSVPEGMEELVSLDQLKAHLNLASSANDDDLQAKLETAQEFVIDYINQQLSAAEALVWETEIAAWTDESCPKRVRGAILQMATWLYKHRGDEHPSDSPKLEAGDLPPEVKLYLTRLRTPSIA
jgi:hypothetical protein